MGARPGAPQGAHIAPLLYTIMHVAIYTCKMRARVGGTMIKTKGLAKMPQACCDIQVQNASSGVGHDKEMLRLYKDRKDKMGVCFVK